MRPAEGIVLRSFVGHASRVCPPLRDGVPKHQFSCFQAHAADPAAPDQGNAALLGAQRGSTSAVLLVL